MIDGVLLGLERGVAPDTMHRLPVAKPVIYQVADETRIAPIFMPLQGLPVDAVVIAHLIALHQLGPLVDDGRLQPAGVSTHAVPQKARHIKTAEPGEGLPIQPRR